MGLLDELDAEQLRAVTLDVPALCVLAGAGSGKTRVLTHRVARRIHDDPTVESHTLVLTFTRKAADELRSRLRGLGVGDGVTAGTFHSVAYAQLRRRYTDAGKAMPAISTHPVRVLEPVLQRLRLDRAVNPRVAASEIAWAKNHGLTPETYEQGLERFRHRPAGSVAQLGKVFEGYEWQKRRSHLLDYEDLLLVLTGFMRTDRTFAAAQRWMFRHFFVDEFQDLNHAQFDLLKVWMQRDGEASDVFLVGDANQSIYGWNGADSTLLQNIERHIPGIEVMRLSTNYRSTSHVLAAAHAVLSAEQVQVEGGDVGVAPVVLALESDEAEAESIARAVRQAHHSNRGWKDIAVLVRTNAQRSVIEDAFLRFGIPFQSTGGAAWLSTSGVRAAMTELRDFGDSPLASRAPDLEAMTEEVADDQLVYVREFARAARVCLAESPAISVKEFLTWVEVTYRFDAPALDAHIKAGGGAVTITTFHRAKGLEWQVVFLAGLEDGLVPLGNVQGAVLEEERRLFYVAITRAQEELHCSWAKRRTTSRGTVDRKPSPWLQTLASSSEAVDVVDVTDVQVHEFIQQGRAHLHVEIAGEDTVRASLERWRAARVKLTGLPAHHILSDAVIDELVRSRPSTIDALAAIEGIGRVRAAAVGEQLLACMGATVTQA